MTNGGDEIAAGDDIGRAGVGLVFGRNGVGVGAAGAKARHGLGGGDGGEGAHLGNRNGRVGRAVDFESDGGGVDDAVGDEILDREREAYIIEFS